MADGEDTLTTVGNIKAIATEIDICWNGYLNALNSLCSAGNKLALSIAKLEQGKNASDKNGSQTSSYLTNSWNDLARATAVATNTVRHHIVSVLQDCFIMPNTGVANEQQQQLPSSSPSTVCEKELKRIRDHNRLIALENAQTMINIQHQFCAASYDAFSSLTCCFVCQSPVGFSHVPDCAMINKQRPFLDQRSQTPSPHCSYKNDYPRANSLTDQRSLLSPAHISEHPNFGIEQPRGNSPQHNFQEAIPLQSIFETIRGPLPNPGQLLAMKTPFCRSNTKSLFNCPLFPLSGQRRWSEAAAVESSDSSSADADGQMRRWSMPWEAKKSDHNTVAWHQTRIMPTMKLSNSPDIHWQSPISSQDGLTEAIQLLSCKPTNTNHVMSNVHISDNSI